LKNLVKSNIEISVLQLQGIFEIYLTDMPEKRALKGKQQLTAHTCCAPRLIASVLGTRAPGPHRRILGSDKSSSQAIGALGTLARVARQRQVRAGR
jgi:hypothetical protein